MTEPMQHLGDGFDLLPRADQWPADHHHRQRQIARGLDFGRGRIASGVPRHHDFGAVIGQHGAVAGAVERSARHDQFGGGERQRRPRRIDQPYQIRMLRMRGEGLQMQPANAEKHPARRRTKRVGRSLEIIDLDPAITGRTRPWRALQRQQRHAGQGAGGDRMRADLRREWMGGVDDARDVFTAQIVHHSVDATEAADPPGNRRRRRIFGPAGIGKNRVDAWIIRHRRGEPVGVGGAAKDQDAQGSGRRGYHDGER